MTRMDDGYWFILFLIMLMIVGVLSYHEEQSAPADSNEVWATSEPCETTIDTNTIDYVPQPLKNWAAEPNAAAMIFSNDEVWVIFTPDSKGGVTVEYKNCDPNTGALLIYNLLQQVTVELNKRRW